MGNSPLDLLAMAQKKRTQLLNYLITGIKRSDDYKLGDKYGHIAIGVKDIHLICKGLENNDDKITTKSK